jgi:cytoskeletal protein RodZ
MVNEVESLESIGEELLEDSSVQDQNREEKLDQQQFRILSKSAVKRRKWKPTGAVIYINYIIIIQFSAFDQMVEFCLCYINIKCYYYC